MSTTSNGSPTNPNLTSRQSQGVGGRTLSTEHLKVPKRAAPPPPLPVATPTKAVEPSGQPPSSVLSSRTPLEEWRGNVTFFPGINATQPSESFENLDWQAFVQKICPNEPTLITDKKDALYFLPCLLRDAPLIGKTLEQAEQNGEPTVGKMRSKDHVTESNVLLFDYDGMEESAFALIRSFFEKHNLTYVAYTTFSHGRDDKPGMHVRVCVPVDQPLDVEAYPTAWHALASLLTDALEGDEGQSGQEGA